MQDMKMTDQVAENENAGHKSAGHETSWDVDARLLTTQNSTGLWLMQCTYFNSKWQWTPCVRCYICILILC